ncbi:MAG: (d)CMP kinase [Nitrospirota bacterium]|nr:(d)CMP kinase [Nitrospirota bacterium]
MNRVIAIDGPSGAGKSTIAKLLAEDLGYEYLDTGALYRAVALGLLRLGLNEEAGDVEITAALDKIEVSFRKGKVFLNHKDVSQEIRSPEASHFASVFSAHRLVRELLLDIQREALHHASLVAEGRDMTTVVFPYAHKKFYLDASAEERAERRTLEMNAKGYEISKEQIHLDIIERDARDSSRDLSPLRIAEDAVIIDSTGLSVQDVFIKILEIIRQDEQQ